MRRRMGRCSKICSFLETAAEVTEVQSGSSYVTLSMSIATFDHLRKNCRQVIAQNDEVLRPIADFMLRKLDTYERLVCSDLARLAKILDPRFPNDIVRDIDLLRPYIPIPVEDLSAERGLQNENETDKSGGVKLLDKILQDDSLGFQCNTDEVTRFIRATVNANRTICPLQWWKGN